MFKSDAFAFGIRAYLLEQIVSPDIFLLRLKMQVYSTVRDACGAANWRKMDNSINGLAPKAT